MRRAAFLAALVLLTASATASAAGPRVSVTKDGRLQLGPLESSGPLRADGVPTTRLLSGSHRGDGTGAEAVFATSRRDVRLRASARPTRDGLVELIVTAPRGTRTISASFAARRGERYLGFGERSNAVDQRGREVLAFVSEGPYASRTAYDVVSGSIPSYALLRRPDATYFPMPWLLSTRGYGVLAAQDDTSRWDLRARRAWRVEADSSRLRLLVVPGPTPAAALRRLTTRIGRQPAPPAPWLLGPWFQTGHANEEPDELEHVRELRRAGAPVSVVETHMRYMPCSADRGREASERRRTRALHAAGLAALTYTREAVCASARRDFRPGAFLERRDGSPFTIRAFVGSGVTPLAFIDFSARAGRALHRAIIGRAVRNGYDGWMEDYGEYAPFRARAASGATGDAGHNRYPVTYHCGAAANARSFRRPIVRFVRSGWTGVAPCAPIVWGGDPATDWGFDGLRSSVTQGLTMGLSGIGLWGSDIGGFFTLGGTPGLTRELLHRWIQFGLVSGVMRTKGEGIGESLADRPQIWERASLPLWRRYATLRTRLLPYLAGAVSEYRRTGLPLMRHHALTHPRDRQAARRDDQFLFGPDLLAAPVTRPGQRRRSLHLPPGRWVDFWRSGALAPRRARLLRGGRTITLPAPEAELPLLVRAGAVLPLTATDVKTLAPYGRGIVHSHDRRDVLELVAWPRGRWSGAFDGDGRLRAQEGRRSWTLRLHAARPRNVTLRAALSALQTPFSPRRVTVNGRRVRFAYAARTGVSTVRFRARSARVVISARR